MFPIWFLNPFEQLPVKFSSCLLADNFPFMLPAIYLVLADEGWFVFVFSNQLFLFFLEILLFGFHLVSSECDAYLIVDQSLGYGGYSKMFLLFFSLILNLIPVLKPSFSWIYWNSVINFPQLADLVYPFFIHNEMNATQFKPKVHNYLNFPIATNLCLYRAIVISCSAHMFSYCFYHWSYILNISLFSSNYKNFQHRCPRIS